LQERFSELWKKSAAGFATPEENEWLVQIQEEYWKNHHDPLDEHPMNPINQEGYDDWTHPDHEPD
jgi:hypothetical protein